MRNLKSISAIMLFVTLALAGSVHGQDDPLTATAMRFLPGSMLKDDFGKDVDADQLETAVALTNLGQAASPGQPERYLVAVYANSSNGAVRVLERQGTDWAVKTTRKIATIVHGPEIELRDLTGDGIPEVIASFKVSPGVYDASWIFGWNGTKLRSLIARNDSDETDPEENPTGGLLVDNIVDLDGDGQMEVIPISELDVTDSDDDAGETKSLLQRSTPQYSAYRIKHGRYTAWRELAFYELPRLRQQPVALNETWEFAVDNPQGAYVLRVVAADPHGNWRITDAQVRLNGALVLGTSHFRQSDPFVTVPVSLQATNVLKVKVTSVSRTAGTGWPDEPVTLTIERK